MEGGFRRADDQDKREGRVGRFGRGEQLIAALEEGVIKLDTEGWVEEGKLH